MAAVERIGREARRRGLAELHRDARLYYLALGRGLVRADHSLTVAWDDLRVAEWLQALELAPFDGSLEVKLPGVPCFKCKPGKGGRADPVRDLVLPGASRMRCSTCGTRWLVLESTSTAVARAPPSGVDERRSTPAPGRGLKRSAGQ